MTASAYALGLGSKFVDGSRAQRGRSFGNQKLSNQQEEQRSDGR